MESRSALLLLLFLLPLAAAPGASSVWDSNEAFYTQTPREMLERGDWLVPHFNGQPRLNKPPLSYWLVAGAYRLFGVSLAVERWVLAALGAACVLLVYGIARRLRPPEVSLLAAGVFATNFRFLVLSRRLLIDVLLLACVLAAILCYLEWRRGKQDRWLLGSALCFGLGFLAKGPVAWIALGVLLVFSLWEDRGRGLREGPWKTALLVLVTVSLGWHLALVWRLGWEPLARFLLEENVGRFASRDFGPSRGPFYYFGVLLADFFPWSLLLAAAAVWKVRGWRRLQGEERAREVLLLLWIVLWFGLFSLSRNKQEYYVLPLYPAAAIWVADVARSLPWTRWLGMAGAAALSILAVALALLSSRLFGPSWLGWLPLAPLLAFAALAWRRRWAEAAACLSLLFALLFWTQLPALEAYRPVPSLAAAAQARLRDRPEARAGYLGLAAPSLRFHLDRPILELFEVEEGARRLEEDRPLYLIVRSADWLQLQRVCRRPLRIAATEPRLVLTLPTLLSMLRPSAREPLENWLRPVHLVTNQTD